MASRLRVTTTSKCRPSRRDLKVTWSFLGMQKNAPRHPPKPHLDPLGDTRRKESQIKMSAPLKIMVVVTIVFWTFAHCPEVHEIRLPLDCLRFDTLVITEMLFVLSSALEISQRVRARRDLKVTWSSSGVHQGAPRHPTKTHLDPPGDTRRRESQFKMSASLRVMQVVSRILWTSVHCPKVHEVR